MTEPFLFRGPWLLNLHIEINAVQIGVDGDCVRHVDALYNALDSNASQDSAPRPLPQT